MRSCPITGLIFHFFDLFLRILFEWKLTSLFIACLSAFRWRMFVFIKTAAPNNLKRMNIRKTWGAIKHVDGGLFSTVFIVGKREGNMQALLDEESARFNDIMQIDESDDYR